MYFSVDHHALLSPQLMILFQSPFNRALCSFVIQVIINHKDWLTFSAGTDRPTEHYYKFNISDNDAQNLNIPIRFVTVSPAVLLVWVFSNF